MITSRDNPRVKRWARLVQDARLRRNERRAIVEGPHLVALAKPLALLVSESGLKRKEVRDLADGRDAVVLADQVFKAIVDAEHPPGIAAEIEIPARGPIWPPVVFLEGVQDPGNVGTILRSAAAFGLKAAVLDGACADPWSPKVLRAGMGAHFSLRVLEVTSLETEVQQYKGRVLCAVPREGVALDKADLSSPIGWLFGSEGMGVSDRLKKLAAQQVTIPMAVGAESINVAAAAAICFHAAYRP